MSTNPYQSAPPVLSSADGGPVSQAETYRPTGTLVKWITIVLVGNAVLQLLLALLFFVLEPGMDQQLEALEATGEIDPALLATLAAAGAFACLVIAIYLVGVVLFLRWVYVANKNARALGAAGMKYSAGWSVGWFFIPIANLFMPYQAVKEIYLASDPEAGAYDWRQRQAPGRLLVWWLVWIAATVLQRADLRLSMRDDAVSSQISHYLGPVAALVTLVAAILAVQVVRAIHRRQEAKASLAKPAPPPTGSPWGELPA